MGQARQYVADELPIRLARVESNKDQIFCCRVWIIIKLLVWKNFHAGKEIWDFKRGRVHSSRDS